jgi:hypothetical protein
MKNNAFSLVGRYSRRWSFATKPRIICKLKKEASGIIASGAFKSVGQNPGAVGM